MQGLTNPTLTLFPAGSRLGAGCHLEWVAADRLAVETHLTRSSRRAAGLVAQRQDLLDLQCGPTRSVSTPSLNSCVAGDGVNPGPS